LKNQIRKATILIIKITRKTLCQVNPGGLSATNKLIYLAKSVI